MSCSATGTPPIYIALIRNFTVLMNTTNTASRKLYQEGNYTCVATSKYGTDVKHFVIKGGEKIKYFEINTMTHIDGGGGGWGFCVADIFQAPGSQVRRGPEKKSATERPPSMCVRQKHRKYGKNMGVIVLRHRIIFLLKKSGFLYRKRWLLQIFRGIFSKCFMARSRRARGS